MCMTTAILRREFFEIREKERKKERKKEMMTLLQHCVIDCL